jgi:DNA-binding CsgD family transcriptional regulator
MATERERNRSRERLKRLSRSKLDRESIQYETIAELRRVIGFDRWCWPVGDPDTLIPLGAATELDFGPAVGLSLALEFSGRDVATMEALARPASPAASLSDETRGDLPRSPRWQEVLRPVGIGDEAIVACRDRLGCWGWIKLYRNSDDGRFDEDDLRLLTAIGSPMGAALRRTTYPPRPGPAGRRPPAVIVLDDDLRVVSLTAGARDWITAFPAAPMYFAFGILPAMVYPVATLARSPAKAHRAHALERAVDGQWVMIEAARLEGGADGEIAAARLEGGADGEIAVTFRPATPGETFDRLCRIYALSRRERQVVAALLQALDTRTVSERLFISQHTVQDHLKSIFERVGVHSRRELRAAFSSSMDGAVGDGDLR